MTFLWGTATSAHQVEGNNIHNDWWRFEQRFKPSGQACAFPEHFETDLDLAVAIGTNTFRFSLEWSRVEPQQNQRDFQAVRYYDRLVNGCLARGLRPMMTLVHFTLPHWCRQVGGWLNKEVHDAFAKHVAWVAAHFGDRVDLFVTFNEPNVQAGAGYMAGVFPPGKKLRPHKADRCLVALLRAHASAYRILHDTIARRFPSQSIQVGPAPHLVHWKQSRWDPGNVVWRAAQLFNWGFLDALTSGRATLSTLRKDLPEIKGTFDFLGVNYFATWPAHLIGVMRFMGMMQRPVGLAISDMGWPIDPDGLRHLLHQVSERTQQPMMVTENGLADAHDTQRPEYLKAHIDALFRAKDAGVDVRGYYHWSLLDNFEWHEGYAPRFGLIAVDYATQQRTIRPSGALYRALIAHHQQPKRASA